MAIDVQAPSFAPALAERMADAARTFLDALSPSQRKAATFRFFGDERYKWNYRPLENMPRNGLWLIAMGKEQQAAAMALLATGLSAVGSDRARRIMQLEATLREHERATGEVMALIRDPELYWWSIFGEPGGREPWGWRVSGHHIGIHFTIVDGAHVSATPLFLGANPAESRMGPNKGDRILAEEEDIARDLVTGLTGEARALAQFSPIAPRDIITDIHRRVWPGIVPHGLPFERMDARSKGTLVDLIRVYLDYTAPDVANNAWRRAEQAGLGGLTFAWAGPVERGHGHYYAISGPTLMIEYDNTQNEGNHIHSVWREWEGDWGEDLLAAHYRDANGHHHHE